MNGSNITHSERTTFQSVTSEFETTMIARLPLDAVDCAMGGVSCVFDNGMVEYGVQSPMMDCPTGMYIIMHNNMTVCCSVIMILMYSRRESSEVYNTCI